MNIYQELYKKSAFPTKCSEEVKKKYFVGWKDKRNQVFDAKRETLVFEKNDSTSKGKENQRTSKNILIKWKNDRKNKEAPKKRPPFVVGIVRHKLYSPPILHKSFKSAEQKKKILRQSFAPKNYKFKPPVGLQKVKINAPNPISVKDASSPFIFNSLFIKQNQIIVNKKELTFDNVTVRPRAKPLTDSSNIKITLKSAKIKKDVNNQKCKDVKEVLCTDDVDEPPIFGKLNLLKFREKTVETKEVPDEASTSVQLSSNQNIKTSRLEDISCASSCLNHQKQQESNVAKDNSVEKDCGFKPPTLCSCSQQIQSLLEQQDLRFTELHSNTESKQKIRTSEMPSPNLSRISFMDTDRLKVDNKVITSIEKLSEQNHNKRNSNSFEHSGSPINDVLNVTIHAVESNDVDDEALNSFNLNSIPNITISENSNSKITVIDKTEHEENDSNTYQDYLPLSENVDSPVKRISLEKILTENEDNKRKELNTLNSLNFIPTFTELKNNLETDEKEEYLTEKETLLENVEMSLNSSNTLENKSIEIENNILSKSNSSNEENTLIARNCYIPDENMITKANVLNAHEASKYIEETIERNAVTKKDNIVSEENPQTSLMFELDELLPKDHNNIVNLQSKIIFSITSSEGNQKSIIEKQNLNEPVDDLIEHEKSATLLKSQLSHTLTNDLCISKMKKSTEYIENQPEVIDLLDSPLKQEKVENEKNPVLKKLYDKITKNVYLSPQESVIQKPSNIKNENAESELSSSRKVLDIIYLEDSPKVEKELSESRTIKDKISYHNLKETRKSVSDDCKSTIVLENNQNKLRNSQTSEIETVDLISDDEEDTESFLSYIKARFAIPTIASPKLKPERVALTSIENVLESPHKILYSQKFLKENSLKTQNISVFGVSPCKTPRSPLIAKENSPVSVASPLKNLSLHSRIVDVSLSPNKTRNTPRKSSLRKNNLLDVNGQMLFNNSHKLNKNRTPASLLESTQEPICKTPRSHKKTEENSSLVNDIPKADISLCVSPQQQIIVEENLPTSSTAVNQTRFLSLRSRIVDVSPSPKKTRNTPRKALVKKNNLSGVNSQTPKNISEELNKNGTTVPSLEILQNSTCNTPRLQEQTKEKIPNLHITVCETALPQPVVKENSPAISVVASPMKVLSLRSRRIDVSPSPKKTKNTPRKALFPKTKIEDVNSPTPNSNSDELNENGITASLLENVQNSTCNTSQLQEQAKEKNIPNLYISPCVTPLPKLLVKENSPETNTVSSPMRILCLRGRKVDITPSPKKKTPKKTPRGKRTPVK